MDTLLEESETAVKSSSQGVWCSPFRRGDYHSGALDAVACIGIPNSPPSVLSKSLNPTPKTALVVAGLALHRFSTCGQFHSASDGRPIRSIGDRALISCSTVVTDRTYAGCFPADLRMNDASDHDSTQRFARRFFAKIHPDASLQAD